MLHDAGFLNCTMISSPPPSKLKALNDVAPSDADVSAISVKSFILIVYPLIGDPRKI